MFILKIIINLAFYASDQSIHWRLTTRDLPDDFRIYLKATWHML
jgi:hypothetical protein